MELNSTYVLFLDGDIWPLVFWEKSKVHLEDVFHFVLPRAKLEGVHTTVYKSSSCETHPNKKAALKTCTQCNRNILINKTD